MQGNAPHPICGSKRSLTSDCFRAWERAHHHWQGRKRECTFCPPWILHFNKWGWAAVRTL